jgi:HSP20 family protein
MADRPEIERLQSEIEALISDMWQVPRFARSAPHAHRPQVDCYRSDEPPRLTVVVELPGVGPDDIEIAASPEALVIAGRRHRPTPDGRVQQMEIEYGPFHRRVQLPEDVDTAHATASYTRGMLTIVLPVTSRPRPPARVAITVQTRP